MATSITIHSKYILLTLFPICVAHLLCNWNFENPLFIHPKPQEWFAKLSYFPLNLPASLSPFWKQASEGLVLEREIGHKRATLKKELTLKGLTLKKESSYTYPQRSWHGPCLRSNLNSQFGLAPDDFIFLRRHMFNIYYEKLSGCQNLDFAS